jgi:DNA-binding ferritin-like protein
MYWQPDAGHAFNDYHQVTDGQFSRLVEEVDKQAQRVSKTLHHPTTNPGVVRDRF